MAAEAKREPGLLRRWLQKLGESWWRSGAIGSLGPYADAVGSKAP